MKNLIIGMFFVLFDVNIKIGISSIGLIPVFVGCFFFWRGCTQLAQESSHFEKMRKPALCLAVYFSITYVLALFGIGTNPMPIVVPLIGVLAVIASFYLVYRIVSGLSDMERRREVDLGASKVSNWFSYMLASQLAVMFGYFNIVLFIVLAIVCVVCSAAFFVAFYKCYGETKHLLPPLGMEEKASI